MNISELIVELQKIEDQTMKVYRLEDDANFVSLDESDISVIELGEACDESGNTVDLDEFPELDGMKVLCINWGSFNEEETDK